jgi:hypothetical protein
MNAKLAKKLRKIARGLGLDPKTTYGPVGQQRYVEVGEDKKRFDLPSAMSMRPCVRRAYKEAKKIYKGLPPTALEPK